MPIYQVIVLALVQALTEFLPVSSQAHLALVPWLFGWKDPGLVFDIALHVGTLVAVIAYFFKDWLQIIAEGFGLSFGNDPQIKRNPRLLWMLVLGTIPAGIAGLLFDKQAETKWRNPYLIAGMLIGVGLVMWLAERKVLGTKNIGQVSLTDAGIIGLSQALALVPGTSRSGITIATGLFRDLDRAASARFSFLLSTPIIAGAALKKLYDVHKTGGIPHEMHVPFLVGIIVSGVGGAFVISFFLRYLRRSSLMPFVYYRIAFGIIVIALAYLFRFTAE
jgi:undecaprenyl-diphosphatase